MALFGVVSHGLCLQHRRSSAIFFVYILSSFNFILNDFQEMELLIAFSNYGLEDDDRYVLFPFSPEIVIFYYMNPQTFGLGARSYTIICQSVSEV